MGLTEAGTRPVDPRGVQAARPGDIFHRGAEGSARLDPCQGQHRRAGRRASSIPTSKSGFIRAEVIAYADYVGCKGEQGAKEAGKMRLEGREYVVRDGDVMHFRFNV